MKTISITVSGKVQGVFFRQSSQEMADGLGVTGTVKNQPNGDVRIIATGSKEQLDALVKWCHQGPRRAEVASVTIEELSPENFEGFRIIR
jgi:acylphosphatase